MMPRPNTPWFRKSKDCWYVTFAGRMLSLKVRGEGNQQAALVAFGKLLAQNEGNPQTPPLPTDEPTVADVLDRFLSDARLRLKPKTVTRYQYDTGVFRASLGTVPIRLLTHRHIRDWIDRLKGTSTTKAIMLRSLSASLGWAVKEDLLPFNPATKVPKPKSRSRSAATLISPDDHRKLMTGATKQFWEVLVILEATGCRPGEVQGVTAQTFFPDSGAVVLTEHKTDRTGKVRVVFLPPEVGELLKAKVAVHPTGPLFRSRKGVGWTGRSITQAMRTLKAKVGVTAIAYGYRHTFITDALVSGVPTAMVAALVGHSGTSVIDKHYSHLGAKADALREALKFKEQKKTPA